MASTSAKIGVKIPDEDSNDEGAHKSVYERNASRLQSEGPYGCGYGLVLYPGCQINLSKLASSGLPAPAGDQTVLRKLCFD